MFILAAAVTVTATQTAQAGSLTFFVDNAVACDDETVDSTATPYCTIQAAVSDAAGGDIVQVAAGVYTDAVNPRVVDVDGKNLTIEGAGQDATFIDGENARSGVTTRNGATLVMSDLTIRNGSSAGSAAGIGLVSAGDDLTLIDVTVKDNTSAASGGGIYTASGTSISLIRTTVSGNTATAAGGGGLLVNSSVTATVEDSVFLMNSAGTDGGAIQASGSSSTLAITRSTIDDSDADDEGGGIWFDSSGGTLTITDSEIVANQTVTTGSGGGLWFDSGTVTISGSLFYNNTSAADGGGVYQNTSGNLEIFNSTFSMNDAATDGGGLALNSAVIANSTITGNTAGGVGGGASRGFSSPTARNSIFAGNTAGTSDPDCESVVSTAGYNIVEANTCLSTIVDNYPGVDPGLLPLADNGGPTRTNAIPTTSPARDAGNPAAPGSGGTSCETTDQRGLARSDVRCDVGAFEYVSASMVGLVDPGTGQWHLRDVLGVVTSFYFGNPGDYPFMGDWDCNGTDTPGLYRQSDGFAYLRNSNTQGNADIAFFFGNPGDIPIIGDYNNDNCDTVSIYRPSQARFYIINALGTNGGGLGPADYYFDFGNPGDQPFSGDFDADGFDEVGLHRASTGLVYFEDELIPNAGGGQADHEFFFGNPGDRFVAGDWNTNGSDSPAVFRPANTTFYFRYTNTQGNADAQFTFGSPTWLPVAGRFGL